MLFFYVFNNLDSKDKLYGLDVGSAFGDVTFDRFGKFIDKFQKVVGVDYISECVKEANEKQEKPENIIFYEADVESRSFYDEMSDIMNQEEIPSFDIIFSSMTIHHLEKPIKVLKNLRKILKTGGYVIIKTIDDGGKLMYPDEDNLMEKIIEVTNDAPGSDRENGRKIYDQLKKSGFKDIKMFYFVLDTVGRDYEEKQNIFYQFINHRLNRLNRAMKNDPDNMELKKNYEWLNEIYEDLEIKFAEDNFYYSELNYAVVARK